LLDLFQIWFSLLFTTYENWCFLTRPYRKIRRLLHILSSGSFQWLDCRFLTVCLFPKNRAGNQETLHLQDTIFNHFSTNVTWHDVFSY
jgi:hypothetical protein